MDTEFLILTTMDNAAIIFIHNFCVDTGIQFSQIFSWGGSVGSNGSF